MKNTKKKTLNNARNTQIDKIKKRDRKGDK